MESFCGFGSEISDRDAQSPRTSRDIVLCHPQALQEGGESIVGIETREYRCSLGGLPNGPICGGKGLPEPATEYLVIDSTLHWTPFPCMGLTEGVNIMSVPLRALDRKSVV